MNQNPSSAELQDTLKALLVLRSEIAEHERRISQTINGQITHLQNESIRFRKEIDGIVKQAAKAIGEEAEKSFQPVTGRYRDAVANLTTHVGKANKLVTGWLIAICGIVLLVVLALWAVLGFYRRELAQTQASLQRHENAAQVLEAFHASEATVCGGLVCIKPGKPMGGGQYRQAKPRETK